MGGEVGRGDGVRCVNRYINQNIIPDLIVN